MVKKELFKTKLFIVLFIKIIIVLGLLAERRAGSVSDRREAPVAYAPGSLKS
jgi:hypothetical protein